MSEQYILKEQNKEVKYTRRTIMKILKEIDFMLISLRKIKKYYQDKDISKYEKEASKFICSTHILSRLAEIRYVLDLKFDLELGDDEMDDIGRACQDVRYWTKPGEYTTKRWVK